MRVRFTIRRLMILVALLAMASALIRVHLSLASLVGGVSCMVLIRTCEKIDRSRAAGRPMGSLGVVRTSFASLVVASMILGASLFPALCIMPVASNPPMHHGLWFGPVEVMSLTISAIIAIQITSFLRRKIW